MTPDQLLDIAMAVSEAARPVPLRYFRKPLEIIAKADESPVTVADRETETVADTRKILDLAVNAAAGRADTAGTFDHIGSRIILQRDADHSLFIIGHNIPLVDEFVLRKDAGDLLRHIGSRDLYFFVFRLDRIAKASKIICNWI